MSSAVYGAIRLRAMATTSVASRTAASPPPGPWSMVLRMAFTSSMVRAMTTLNLNASSMPGASARKRCVTRRSASSPVFHSISGALVMSPVSRQARARNFAEPDGETSSQSMSSSGGPANAIVRRMASTPWRSISEPRSTPPLLFDILLPPESTMPWLSSALNGSVNVT